MPKTEEEYRKIREAQRENILTAAKAALLRHGWAATMSDIAAEAKISQGLAYRYFDSKEAIFAEIFGQMLEKMIYPSDYAAEDSSPTLRLSGLINRMLSGNEFFGNFELAFRASVEKTSEDCFPDFMRGGESFGKEFFHMMKQKLHSLMELVAGIIKEGQQTGEFVYDDPQKLTLMLLSATKGLTHLAIHQPKVFKEYYPYTDALMRLVLNENHKKNDVKVEPQHDNRSVVN